MDRSWTSTRQPITAILADRVLARAKTHRQPWISALSAKEAEFNLIAIDQWLRCWDLGEYLCMRNRRRERTGDGDKDSRVEMASAQDYRTRASTPTLKKTRKENGIIIIERGPSAGDLAPMMDVERTERTQASPAISHQPPSLLLSSSTVPISTGGCAEPGPPPVTPTTRRKVSSQKCLSLSP